MRRSKLVLFVLAFLGIAVIAVFAICNHLTAKRATEFVNAIRKLDIGSNEGSQILRIAEEFRAQITSKSPGCDATNCLVEFTLQNPVLKLLQVPTRSRLNAGLRVENHKIGYLALFFTIGGGDKPSSSVSVLEFAYSGSQGFSLEVLPKRDAGVPKIFVRFDKRASDAEKDSIFSLNLSCLNRPLHCRDAFDLAPLLARNPAARNLLSETGGAGNMGETWGNMGTDGTFSESGK